MAKVDLVGVGIVKTHPTTTGGPGGTQAPPALADKPQGVADQFQQKLSELRSTIDHERAVYLTRHSWKPPQKNKISQKSTKTQKNTKIVRMTSYSQVSLSKKLAAQKYQVLIFRTNEGDFSGTPVKNQ